MKFNFFESLRNHISSTSLLYILIPYLVINYLEHNSIFQILFFVLLSLLIDLVISRKIKNHYASVFFISFNIIFFYGFIFFSDTEIKIHSLRLREFLIIFSVLILILVFVLKKHKKGSQIINFYFLFFGVTFLFGKNQNIYFNRSNILENNNFKYANKLNPGKKIASTSPVLFLIFDELSSTSELFKETKDSIDLIFDKSLEKHGYEIIPDFYSRSTHTKFSVPSIFNFNLHRESTLLDSLEPIQDMVTIQKSFYWIASNNLLVDSLNNKSIDSHSFGLFPFNKGIEKKDFIYWWPMFSDPIRMFGNKTLLSNFFQKSLLKPIETKLSENVSVELFKLNVLDQLVNLKLENNNFYYFHIYGPHEPFKWGDEYIGETGEILDSDQYLEEHIKFRRFLFNKIFPILNSERFINCKIIISGDHGFRFNKKINPKLTNLYLYNYPKGLINDSISVQDLGYLINNSFN